MRDRGVRGRVTQLRDHADRDVLHAMAQGDEDALREIYRRYGGLCFGLAARILGDRSLAEDVVQEVFLAAWRAASGFDADRGSVRSWLLTQIHHRAVDAIRREASERRRNQVLALPDLDREPAPSDAVVEQEWISMRREQVRGALTQLSTDQREVLELAYFSGLTQRQIAERLDAPLGTVKSRTITALRRLRATLSADPAWEDA